MTRAFATPEAFKASLEDRLRTRARATGMDLQRLRQLVVYDRFLVRLFAHDSADVVLKGGLALELRCAISRATRDVDLRMLGRPDAALERLQTAGRLALGDFFTFLVLPDARHPTIEAEGMIYEGHRFRTQGLLAGKPYGRPFGVDVAFGEPMTGGVDILEGEDWLAFAGLPPARARAYPLLTHIAEKVHAYTLPRPVPNSRVKDLPDVALLAAAQSLDANALRSAIRTTFGHRGTHEVPAQVPDPPDFWTEPYGRLAADHGLPWRDLSSLLVAVRAFLDPALQGIEGTWSPDLWSWKHPHQGSPPEEHASSHNRSLA